MHRAPLSKRSARKGRPRLKGYTMAIRIRKDGTMLCAAKSEKMDGDKYIDDGLHGLLGQCYKDSLNILKVVGHDKNGAEIWEFNTKIENFRELRFLLPSGEAILFVPREMTTRDFDVLDMYLNTHKIASNIENGTEAIKG